MQLTKTGSIAGTLTALTATLLGGGAIHAAGDNRLESSLLLYSETNRVTAGEGILSLTRALKDGRFVSGRFTLDGLTGASPNGATPSNAIQTFTRPSGNGSYTVKPGEIPLDRTFKDTRYGFDGSLTLPLDRFSTAVFGGHVSLEHDYTSVGTSVALSRDLNKRNTTLSVSAAVSHDNVSPLGGTPAPLSLMTATTGGEGRGEDDEDGEIESPGKGKNVLDAMFGITQVLDRRTLLRFNYSLNHASGYLNDPYKLLSVVQPTGAGDPGEPLHYLYEARPDSRTKHALFGELRRYIGRGHTINLSYRYFWDDWGIVSRTLDVHYHLPLVKGHALEPHVRWYRQTGADFYRAFLVDGTPLPSQASADYRLAPFHAFTVGLQYALPVAPGAELRIGTEFYRQTGDVVSPTGLGPLSSHELFPNMDAIMVRIGFSRRF